jgi:DNA polymerase-3 subunit delta
MKVIKEHIKSGSFKSFYLLYGSEGYLKKLYRDKLKTAILGDQIDINFSYFEGKDLDIKKVAEVAQTLPFFHDKRLIMIENSNLFKTQSEISDMLQGTPETTILLFVENEVDKRNKLFKMVKDHGYVSEINGLDEKNLKLFVASLLEQEGRRITENTVSYLLDRTGSDMENIRNEVEKIIGYTFDRGIVTPEDIDAVVTIQTTGKIFQMIDAIGLKQKTKALSMYYDLLTLREKPMSILFLLIRHFNLLLQVKDLHSRGFQPQIISEKVGIPPFAAGKYIIQTKNFTLVRLKEAIEFGTEVEEQIKTGRLVEKIGVELFIITFSK